MPRVTAKSAQEFVPIREIRDGIVIMKDGSLRAALMASSLNFALKSGDEQQAIIFQYQNFLNSLDFSVQFFMQSRKLNINPYLDTLKDVEKSQTDEQQAIIFQYQNFLNSLDFSVQFFMQSRKLNINPYLDTLKDVEKSQTNE